MGLLVVVLLPGCSTRPTEKSSSVAATPVSSGAARVQFTEVADQAGIHFRHNNGATGKKYMPETVGSGLAFFDYDNDGRQDLLIVNGMNWPGDEARHDTPHLYHNEGGGQFRDVTEESGLAVEIYGMGVAVGDFDNDGYEDLFITAIGRNYLFRNTLGGPRASGAGSFVDVTESAGLEGYPIPDKGMGLRWKWSASAAWLDYDKDGRLDLFVTNYVKWSPKTDVFCGEPGKKAYCAPGAYEGFTSALYRNLGGGKFKDVSDETGIRGPGKVGKGFGVAVADYNGDGWPDIAVSNDTWPNFLFLNEGGKQFVESGVESGIGMAETGKPKAGMGIDAADWTNSGRFGLLIGNFSGETLSLFENDGHAQFVDRAHPSGLGDTSLLFLTFGVAFFDYDLDGWQDAVTANGHIDDFIHSKDIMLTYKERPLLFHNRQGGKFEEVGKRSGPGLQIPIVGRGAAFADIDNDGDLDFAILSTGDRLYLYRNDGGNANRWIRFRTVGSTSNRDGLGAVIRVTANGVTQSQVVKSGGSFLSESQRERTFGLGKAAQADRVEVVWPSGQTDKTSAPLRAGAQYLVTEGQGFSEDPRAHLEGTR